MDTETIQAKGLAPVQGLLDRAHSVTDLTELAAFLGMFERIGGPGLFGSYITPDRGDASQEHRLPRAGRPRPARRVLLPRGQVRRDPGEVPRLPDDAAHPQRARRPGGRGRARAGVRVPAGRGPLGGRRDPRRPEDDQPPEPRGAARALPGLRLDHLRHRPRRHRGDAAALDRHAARLLLPPVDGAGGDADRDLARDPARPHRAELRALPARCVRRGQLRLLRPHPQRHPGAARPLEARRRLRRGRHRRGRRQGLRRAALPAHVQADDGRARRQPRHGLPALDRGARLDGRGHQAEGVRQARPLLPQDRLPDGVPRLLLADRLRRRPDGQRRVGLGVRDRPPAREGRPAGRPRRVADAPADRQRLLPPGHQRDLLPGRHPPAAVLQPRRRATPRTTAASARSSATSSATASTTRAPSTTATATSRTGGPPTTRPPSRASRRRSSRSTTPSSRATCRASTSTAASPSARTSATSAG